MAISILRLLLGDQLNPNHSWFSEKRADVLYVMMEVRQETDYVLHHAQKVIGVFAAMLPVEKLSISVHSSVQDGLYRRKH